MAAPGLALRTRTILANDFLRSNPSTSGEDRLRSPASEVRCCRPLREEATLCTSSRSAGLRSSGNRRSHRLRREDSRDGSSSSRGRARAPAALPVELSSPPLAVATPTRTPTEAAPLDSPLNSWDDIGFGLRPTDYMFHAQFSFQGEGESREGGWSQEGLRPYGPLELSPAAGVLNYGQGCFEGLKAYRTEDGRILLFRPDANAQRMQDSAARLSMPQPPQELFLKAVKETVAANLRWIPPPGKGSLYIRPLLIGTGAVLGLAPAPEFTFITYVSPVGNYFKGGQLTPIQLVVEETFHRACPGGTGGAKVITNYAPVLNVQLAAKAAGFADVVYLDAVENRYVEEVSSCNILVVKGKKLVTPGLGGTILPGITRRSVLELAQSLGYEVEERPVAVEELLAADEVFCTGTAVVISPVGGITYRGQKTTFQGGEVGRVAQQLYTGLTEIQMGKAPDPFNWTVEVGPSAGPNGASGTGRLA
eukprot:TRINITY_DN23302_c0_g1_i1.p1 TRINITY_DN23302_c0_g1~~TRINITY_DN23302_c0_g1_i1.p1  ORF type:complete len:500 (+),score=90.81 TRINITY_DN23302_c0_g1_i1:68-1501(+)